MANPSTPKSVTLTGLLAATESSPSQGLRSSLQALAEARVANTRDAIANRSALRAALPANPAAARRVLGLLKLAQAAGDAEVAVKALAVGGASLAEIGRMSPRMFVSQLGRLDPEQTAAAHRLARRARVMYRAVSDHAAAQQAYQASTGAWLRGVGKDVPVKVPPKIVPTICFDCACCDSAFGPRAYLFDLLDLLYYRFAQPRGGLEEPRRITSDVLEAVLFQEIDRLECAEGETPLPQVRIACEVLEKFLKPKVPLDDSRWTAAWRAGWAGLLAPGAPDAGAFLAAADASLAGPAAALRSALESARPLLETLDAATAALQALIAAGAPPPVDRPEFLQRMAATVAALLATYRDRLIAVSGKDADALGAILFTDMTGGSCQTTTRYGQLIVSLQAFILAIRSGEVTAVTRPDLPPQLIDFDALDPRAVEEETWRWLGNFSTWKAAMYTLIFPENVLPPPLLEPRLDGLADAWSLGVTPAEVRVGFVEVYFGMLAQLVYDLPASAGAMAHIRAARIANTAEFARIYGGLDAFVADVEALGRAEIFQATASDDVWPPSAVDRVRFLEFPLLAAWALNRAGEFAAAYDWLRRLYDPTRPPALRVRFDFDAVLELGPDADPDVVRASGASWLDDPLDPRLIARRRRGVYLRHVVLAMVRNLLDWADHEFAQEDAESVDRARQLYLLARRALAAPELDRCDDALRTLELDIVLRQEPFKHPGRDGVRHSIRRLSGVRHREVQDAAARKIRALAEDAHGPTLARRIDTVVERALREDAKRTPRVRIGGALASRRRAIGDLEDHMVVGFTPEPGPGPGPTPGPDPGDPFGGRDPRPGEDPFPPDGRPFDDPIPTDPEGGIPGGETGWADVPSAFLACVPENPVLAGLRLHIQTNLTKIRSCLSIANEPLHVRLPSCDPTAGAAAPRGPATTDQAPRYRYSFLVDKARQFIDVAQRLESALVQALEKREQARFDVLRARQASDLAGATVELRGLQVTEAVQGRTVAELQQERAGIQTAFWEARLGDAQSADATLSALEKDALFWTDVSWKLQAGAAAANAAMVLPQIAMASAGAVVTTAGGIGGLATAETGLGLVAGGAVAAAGITMGTLSLAAGLPGIAGALSAAGGAASTYANMQQTKAGYERRFEEWTLQRDLAHADAAIADAGLAQAETRVSIAEKEEQISRLQLTQSREVLEFLRTRFDNVELYEWMVDVLMRNYRVTMQLATSVARLAQRALEFERQEAVNLVLSDYWTVTNTSLLAASLSEEQGNAGLLGAERLLTDLTKLDAFKLHTETRRLQMTRTISLAQVLPIEFQELRRTGRVTFNTLLDWFDRDFPGHYLRLVRSVRVSVLALVPPLDGIHATLSNGGESSVVVPRVDPVTYERGFVKQRAMRNFGETVALDAAFSESGLFELRADDPMLLPFESLGVETQWTLEMPQAFNRFNFGTLADVLLAIEYTALADPAYRTEVVAALPARDTLDAAFDLGFAFPDGWYQLKNPRPADPPADRVLPFALPRAFFAPQFAAAPVVVHAALVVTGDFTELHGTASEAARLRDIIREGFTLEHDSVVIQAATLAGSSAPAFAFAEVTERSALLSTRTALSALTPSPFGGALVAPGDWTLRVRQTMFAERDGNGAPLIRRVINALLVLTVDGPVSWS